ncbi:MAG: hypothetical protein U1D30_11900 [Planctomycetota bacterium]
MRGEGKLSVRTSNQSFTALMTLLVLLAGYFVYENTLGRVTDFEQLPAEYATALPDDKAFEPDPETIRESEVAAVRGFGPDCAERLAPLTLEYRKKDDPNNIPGRGLGMFVYFQDYKRDPDDTKLMRLHPFSLVQINRSVSGRPEEDEIIVVRGDEAILEFDQPVELTKVSSVKPVAGRVEGNVEIKSNGRTVDPADDMVLLTDKLHYREEKHLVWADDWIRVVAQDQGTVTGVGMELELFPDAMSENSKRKDPAKRIRIFKNVRFDLLVREEENFLGPAVNPTRADPEEGGAKPTMTPITVTSRGPFEYNMETKTAEFTKSVQVLRRNPPKVQGSPETFDQQESDKLVLQFREKTTEERAQETARNNLGAETPSGPVHSTGRSLKLQNVTATGKQVILLSDSEHLQATGNYLFYDADTRRAELRSDQELVAVHDNAIIHGRSLVIEQGEGKDVRNFIADGPNGWLEVLEEGEGKAEARKAELKIKWEGRLTMESKPGSDSRVVNITDNVELEDNRGGALKSDVLKVWLVPAQGEDGGQDGNTARRNQRKLEPIKLEALGNVSAHSPDLAVVTEMLSMDIVKRKELPPTASIRGPETGPLQTLAAKPPAVLPPPDGASAPPASKESTPGINFTKAVPNPHSPIAPKASPALIPAKPPVAATPAPNPQPEERKEEPLDVRAKRVAVVVERIGSKSRPIRAWADGDVLVTQDPSKPDQEPLEVRGQTLQFERKPDGDVMKVEGSDRRMASVKSADATIAARNQIHFDEIKNRVTVSGPGHIIRASDNDLNGQKLEKPQMLRIDWERSMDFDGKVANFEGGVKAQQGTQEIYCQNMDVAFRDRINFHEARQKKNIKGTKKTEIETVDCDKDVIVYNVEREQDDSVRYTTMRVSELRYDAIYRTTVATGPGVVQVIDTNKPKTDENGKVKPPPAPYQLTKVSFLGRMRGDQGNMTAKFFENVHIVHAPIQQVDEVINEDKLPADGIVVDAADEAIVAVRTMADGTKQRDFQSKGDVRVQAREFWGQCDRLTYDQEKDRLVFESLAGRKAQFFRQTRIGQKPEEFFGRTITFIRKLNKINIDSSDGFNSLDIAPGAKNPLSR